MAFSAFGIDMLGKLATNLSDTYGTGNTLRAKQREEAQGDYLERERLGIVARAEGAKAAGLHPLVAMGYQGGNSPTQIIGASQAPEYKHVPPSAKSDPVLDRYNHARMRSAEAEADQAEDALRRSRANLASQPGQPIAAQLPTSDANLVSGRTRPGVKLVPDEVTAGSSGLSAGTHQGMSAFETPGIAGSLNLPSKSMAESLEDLDVLKYWLTYKANEERINSILREKFIPSSSEAARENESLKKRFPPKGKPGKWPARMHGGRVNY